jgi:hypothetical protein
MAKTLIATATASSSSSLSFTSGIDSTYDVYEFHYVNCHPGTDSVWLTFQVNAAGASGFNETMTTSYFRAYHYEDDSNESFEYQTSSDQQQGTSYQRLSTNAGNDNDQSVSGVLTLYAPSSTTYVKHFVSRSNSAWQADGSFDIYVGGYINTTSAIDEIDFKFSSGNIDAGTIKMFGVS